MKIKPMVSLNKDYDKVKLDSERSLSCAFCLGELPRLGSHLPNLNIQTKTHEIYFKEFSDDLRMKTYA